MDWQVNSFDKIEESMAVSAWAVGKSVALLIVADSTFLFDPLNYSCFRWASSVNDSAVDWSTVIDTDPI